MATALMYAIITHDHGSYVCYKYAWPRLLCML